MQKKFRHPALALCSSRRRQKLNYQHHRQTHRFEEYCRFFAITRQGYHQHRERQRKQESVLMQQCALVAEIHLLRKRLPRLGGRKLLYKLKERVPALLVGIGRDAFFDFLRQQGLLVTPKKLFRAKTTDSRHSFRRYPDRYNERRSTFCRPFMALVADITYIHTLEGFGYAAILADAASRMVIGFDLSDSLSVEGSLRAAQMMLKVKQRCAQGAPQGLAEQCIHHSDK